MDSDWSVGEEKACLIRRSQTEARRLDVSLIESLTVRRMGKDTRDKKPKNVPDPMASLFVTEFSKGQVPLPSSVSSTQIQLVDQSRARKKEG